MKSKIYFGRKGWTSLSLPESGTGACVLSTGHFCQSDNGAYTSMKKHEITLTWREAAKVRDWLNERLADTKYASNKELSGE